tara:strand:- start:4763 stop:4972 length:210 start_codon:yes stop_codon:yes gene_type:complete
LFRAKTHKKTLRHQPVGKPSLQLVALFRQKRLFLGREPPHQIGLAEGGLAHEYSRDSLSRRPIIFDLRT